MAQVDLHVVDLYKGDQVESFERAAAAGIWGIIHKASTGATGRDAKYAERRPAALAAGLLWGAYHWGTAADVTRQVENFMKAARPDESTLVALDFEITKGNQMSLDQAREFMEQVNARLGRKPVLYSGHLVKEQLGARTDSFFGSHRLWLAQYSDTPSVHKSWKSHWLWQYTDGTGGPGPRRVAGLPGDDRGNLDCNSYSGTRAELAAEWAS